MILEGPWCYISCSANIKAYMISCQNDVANCMFCLINWQFLTVFSSKVRCFVANVRIFLLVTSLMWFNIMLLWKQLFIAEFCSCTMCSFMFSNTHCLLILYKICYVIEGKSYLLLSKIKSTLKSVHWDKHPESVFTDVFFSIFFLDVYYMGAILLRSMYHQSFLCCSKR